MKKEFESYGDYFHENKNIKFKTMKNIYLSPTDKPSRLHLGNSGLALCDLNFNRNTINGQNIYITSDEEIKEGDWCITAKGNLLQMIEGDTALGFALLGCKKIILTTDQDLIKDGVQAIDDEFLEWFVKNPYCEWVEIEEICPLTCCIQKEGKTKMNNGCMERNRCLNHKIIIPQETLEEVYLKNIQEYAHQKFHHKETLEEAAEKHWKMQYIMALDESTKPYIIEDFISGAKSNAARDYWFEQFKKK